MILEIFQGSRFSFQATISPTRTPELNLALLLHKVHTISAVQTEAKEAVTIRGSQFGDSENTGGPEDAMRSERRGITYNERDMWRMGKLQQLRRNFHFFSIFGYSAIVDLNIPE